jgi:hypothetical protein
MTEVTVNTPADEAALTAAKEAELVAAAAKEAELRARREQLLAKLLPMSLDSTADSAHIRSLLCRNLSIDALTADEIIVEYKRFILIAGTADHPCSPSAIVDEVWHLHVSEDSENYYSNLCSTILERIVFHEPRRKAACDPLAASNAAKFKTAYESLFGAMNPRFWQ